MIPLVAALIKFGLPLIAGAVASKGEEVIKDKLGIDIGTMLGSEEGRIRLKEAEMHHQEFLVSMAQQSEARELDFFKAEVEDRSSARTANTAIATSEAAPWYQKMLMPAMAVLVTFGFFGCMGALFYLSAKNIKLDDNSRDVLIYAFGTLTAGWLTIMNFLYGTSQGSRDNQKVLANIAGSKQ